MSDLIFNFSFHKLTVRACEMSKATQQVKEQNCREHKTCQDTKKNSQLYLFSPVCKSPNLDEADYLGTRHYTAEGHPTQSCRAEDSKGWQKRSNSFRLLCHRISPFLFNGGVRQKAGQLPMHLPPFLQDDLQRVMKSTPMLRPQIDCY